MIRVARGAEPSALRDARATYLPRARAALGRGESPDWTGYQLARSSLYRAQHGKCAYCEMQHLEVANPTEHFRPKAKVTPEPGHVTLSGGYWWLAWDWRNLLFSCTTCNSPANKGNHFALAPGSTPLTPEASPPGGERPMFIDPASEDPGEEPLDHIVFVQRTRGEWVPRPRRGSPRGDYTITKLGLDKPDLLTLYRDHVEHTIQPALERVRSTLRSEDARAITKAWSRCLRKLFHPRQRFMALSHDVLDASFPTAVRARWRLILPRP